ncbi:CPBP family intramembrane glutamic endopeptidase [Dongia deserti]|uniref:CPBP family intramembrane glutamic endopeptidase n=1 Tax=Dongia deserti TaxID=2268030 RepID=UPI000E65990A|nr:CPBP family intramembrane glutamic endopeptidase [Dongia deserti]
MQDSPEGWLIIDYIMRASVLGLLALSPMRVAVFQYEALRGTRSRVVGWSLAAGAAAFLTVTLGLAFWDAVPNWNLGEYPNTTGWVRRFDLTFGLALVALHEELFFRRFARLVFSRLGDGIATVAATSLVFALYHWWAGLPNILITGLIGVVLMLLYRAVGVLWPAIVIHYFLDVYAFS